MGSEKSNISWRMLDIVALSLQGAKRRVFSDVMAGWLECRELQTYARNLPFLSLLFSSLKPLAWLEREGEREGERWMEEHDLAPFFSFRQARKDINHGSLFRGRQRLGRAVELTTLSSRPRKGKGKGNGNGKESVDSSTIKTVSTHLARRRFRCTYCCDCLPYD
jgi:hypothetical protein